MVPLYVMLGISAERNHCNYVRLGPVVPLYVMLGISAVYFSCFLRHVLKLFSDYIMDQTNQEHNEEKPYQQELDDNTKVNCQMKINNNISINPRC